MNAIYCKYDKVDWDTIDRHDSELTIYGDNMYSSIDQKLIEKISRSLDSIRSITLKNIIRIENNAFSNLSVNQFELTLPDTLEYIGDYAFSNCTAVNDIIIPSSVTYLGTGAFYGCGSLNNIYFKEDSKITYIPSNFCSAGGLNRVGILYNNGTKTASDAIEFPMSVTEIKDNAFEGCSSFGHTIYISDNVKRIGNKSFYGTVINNINLGSGLNSGSSSSSDDYNTDYDTDRNITVPYTVFISSKRQFRYNHIDITEEHEAGYLYKLNNEFKYCILNSHLMVFKNGLLLPPTYYYLHSVINTPVNDVGVIFNVDLAVGDRIDIFYVTNDMKHLETSYYNSKAKNKERYIQNGMVLVNSHNNEYRVMGEQLYDNDDRRTNYIKLRSPLYAISSRHSTFVFLNGKKIRLDELEDISDTIMAINSDYTNRMDMDAVRLEVLNHLDTQDIIEQLYINDGLSHDEKIIEQAFSKTNNPNEYKNTLTIKNFSLKNLEEYSKRTLLDEILNDLNPESLNRLFYDYDTAQGPMTHYIPGKMQEPNFINKDEILQSIIDEYYSESNDPNDYIKHTQKGSFTNTIFYIGRKDKVNIPGIMDDEPVKVLYSTTFNNNSFLKKVVIPEGVERIE